MEGAGPNPINDPLLQVAAETRWVGLRQTDIFVEVEEVDPTPIDVRLANQSIEKLKLRGAGSCDHISLTARRDRLTDETSSVARCCLGQLES